jgi:FkbM family methyltransferase
MAKVKRLDINVLFSQLRPFLAIKMLCFTAFNRLLNPYGNIFYGFSAEDQVIQTLLGYPESGFYVDVGSNHPIKFSNTFAFYTRGWKGLTIDANSSLIELHKKVRPKDTNICCAISDSEESVVFTNFSDDSMSSISADFVKEFQDVVPIVSKEIIKTRTLNSILKEHNIPSEFDFLSIDVEGHDFEVITSINLVEYKPKLIVIEMRKFSFEHIRSNNIVAYLEKSGYKLVAYYSLNGFFLRRK